ncbi:tetratricopeptide repeat protein [Mycobacterium sp. NBC_00419]|uniref:tetratricopeptide repeat protein n=1 Tax=Mycobacterium sp. NBC_00419 TaxID=2975989 RepID=UPI002E1D8602
MTAVADDVEGDESPAEETAIPEVVAAAPTPRKWLLRGALAALVVALLGLSGFLGWQVWQQHRVAQASHDAQQAAVTYAQVLTSIDTTNVDKNFADVLDGATGEFKDMYSRSSAQLRQLLVDNKATAHGVVVDSAVQSASPEKVVVLMFVDQTVANSAAPDPRIDRSRVKMTMEYVDGRWRASKVELP